MSEKIVFPKKSAFNVTWCYFTKCLSRCCFLCESNEVLRDFELFNFDFYLNRKRNESLFRTAASLSSIPVVTLLIGHTILLLYCRIGK